MKKLIVPMRAATLILLLLCPFAGSAQTKNQQVKTPTTRAVRQGKRPSAPAKKLTLDADPEHIYERCEENPQFPGGEAELFGWLGRTMHYPEAAQKAKEEGRVIVRFIVEKDGSISAPEVVKQVSPALDAEGNAIQAALTETGNWAATIRDLPKFKDVRSYFVLPIMFKMN